ncbi:hypothetical protein BACCIP111883_04312 [Sutcliffiella rhizosphaerae]|uniref:Helicase Helix-turn-helix domain-containing protein n=1 Tax=Sutcliffiella rhizosphaerae TaxID=2880967 RepID=A0ABM8YU60_9BACI|nr:hypothetical protein BACCIP111883_04312 [Sutcliffiella rhizosphaerae]
MVKSFEYLCLVCLHAFRGERSISAIYHLFKGKKSSQTIQDAHIFSLRVVYGLFPELSRTYLDVTIDNLVEQKAINGIDSDHYIVTAIGKATIKEASTIYPLSSSLNGYLYKDKSTIFWKRLSLLIQTLSNLAGAKRSFIPVQYEESVQNWVRYHLLSQKGKTKRQLLDALYMETSGILEQLPEEQAIVFVNSLSGYIRTGKTVSQIAKQLQTDPEWIQIQFQSVLHTMLEKFENKHASETFPILLSVCHDLMDIPQLTETAQRSMKLLNKGLSIDAIAKARRLKISTIEDHIVEMSMQLKKFQIEPYMTEEQLKTINTAIVNQQSHQLRKIKNYLQDDTISYFQIRLVLSRMGDGDES